MPAKKLDIDPVQVRKLAAEGCKVTEIAEILGVSRETIHGRFSTEIAKGRVDHKLEIRRAFNRSVKLGNSGILLQMGRQYLGFGDRSLDEHILEAIESAGLDQEDIIELIKNKDTLFRAAPKRSFHEFCAKAGYPAPFDIQVKMKEFGICNEGGLLLGSRGYGKTDYVTIAGTAYDIYCEPTESTTLVITKSKDRNAAILHEIAEMCRKNGMSFEVENTTRLRVFGLEGKEDSASVVPIKTKSLRGRHPRRVIMDDPVTEDDTSEATRTHARKILNEAMKLTTNVLLIGQPAHQYDLYADVRGKMRTMEVKYGAIPELDPDLDAIRIAGVSEASISASFFLEVLSEGTSPFNSVKYIDRMIPGDAVAFIDPSEGGDYTAMTIFKGYMDGVAIVGFVRKKAWNHCLDEFAPLLAKYNVKRIAFETNKHGQQPVELLRGLFKGIGVVGWNSSDNKHAAIMNAGVFAPRIHLCKESDKLYIDHVVKYEYKSKFDDAPDSVARGLQWLGLVRRTK